MASESESPLTWGVVLATAERTLRNRGAMEPGQSAVDLLSSLLRAPIPALLAHPMSPIAPAVAEVYETWIARYAAGEALAHITGHLEFMGLDIMVGETSPPTHPVARWVVETALHWARRRASGELSAADIGAGCGAIALALAALEPSFTRIYATDSSPTSLEAAQANGARYLLNLVISWREGEGLAAIPDPVDLIICGQPGWMGFEQLPGKLRPGGAVICAVGERDKNVATELFARYLNTFPFELFWVEGQGDGYSIAVASRLPDADEDL
jgi:methylase of polypeptide subunit release factors